MLPKSETVVDVNLCIHYLYGL